MKKTAEELVVGCAGHTCLDLAVLGLEGSPGWNALEQGREAYLGLGGPGGAGAFAANRLGLNTRYITVLGGGVIGDVTLMLLQQGGLDTSKVARSSGQASATGVLVNKDGRRAFAHVPGVNNDLSLEHFPRESLAGLNVFHIAGIGLLAGLHGKPLGRLFARCKDLGMITSMDTVDPGKLVPGSAMPWIAPALPHCDILTISEAEADDFVGDTEPARVFEYLRIAGAEGMLVYKMGPKGALVLEPGEGTPVRVPTYDVPVKNGTGSGDAFSAAVAIRTAMGETPQEAVAFANALGSIVVREGVGVAGVPRMNEVEQFMGTAKLLDP